MKHVNNKRITETQMKIRESAAKAKMAKIGNVKTVKAPKPTKMTSVGQLPDKTPEKADEEIMITTWRDNAVLTLNAVDKDLIECGFVLDRRFGYLVGLPFAFQLRKYTLNDLPVWDIKTQRWLCPQAVDGMTPSEVLKWMYFTGLGGICEPHPWDCSDDKETNAEGRVS